MPPFSVTVTDLVIANGAQESNALSARNDYGDADVLTIFAPATLPETVSVQVAPGASPLAGDWRDLDEGAGDITIGAGQARKLELPGYGSVRLRAGAAVAAERRFAVAKTISA